MEYTCIVKMNLSVLVALTSFSFIVVFLMIVAVISLQTIRYIVEDSDTRTILNGGRLHHVSGCSTAATNLL